MSERYAIVDIETTGGMYRRDRITEIAVVVIHGQDEVDRFESLIDPERSIPPYISRMTGITDDMVSDAPKFYEIGKRFVKITEGAVFVAHNVQFDYRFIREEFRRLGYIYKRRKMCTVKLARKTFPGLSKYSLGHLIRHFDIAVTDRHRAMADVEATVELFHLIRQTNDATDQIQLFINSGVKNSHLPDSLSIEGLHKVPESCGVYYLKDAEDEIIYIGKSKNIQSRIFQHFAGQGTKNNWLREQVQNIDWEITGSELISLLYESAEIKRKQPRINRAQKRTSYNHYLMSDYNERGYRVIYHQKSNKVEDPSAVLGAYPTRGSAESHLTHLKDALGLCPCLLGMHQPGKDCVYRQMEHCRGAFYEHESPEEYNIRADEAASSIDQRFEKDFLVVDEGRSPDERSLILIEKGKIAGYGYCSKAFSIEPKKPSSWRQHIRKISYNPEIQRITRNYIKHNKKKLEKIVLQLPQAFSD